MSAKYECLKINIGLHAKIIVYFRWSEITSARRQEANGEMKIWLQQCALLRMETCAATQNDTGSAVANLVP